METTIKTILEIITMVMAMTSCSMLMLTIYVILSKLIKGDITFKEIAKACANAIKVS
jgi:hypothetical protein